MHVYKYSDKHGVCNINIQHDNGTCTVDANISINTLEVHTGARWSVMMHRCNNYNSTEPIKCFTIHSWSDNKKTALRDAKRYIKSITELR